MNLEQYIERSRILDLSIVAEKHRPELLRLLEEGIQLPELVQDYRFLLENLPRAQLHRLFEARVEWRARKRARDQLDASLARGGFTQPPQVAKDRALVPHKVDALERAVRICPEGDFADEEAWGDALTALLDVWSGAVNQTLRRGSLKVRLDPNHADLKQFEEFARRTETLSDLQPQRWQVIRRGLRVGALTVDFEPPISAIKGHLTGVLSRLGPKAGVRDVDDLIDEMVLSVLDGYVRGILDQRAEDDAVRNAVKQYQKLLTGAALATGRIGAVAISDDGKTVGAIVCTEGDIPELQDEISTAEEGWEGRLAALFEVAGIEQVAVPMSSPATEIHRQMRAALEEPYELLPVRVSAVAEARAQLMDAPLELPAQVASALVIARRALQPADAWEQVDPVAIGLAEYQNDLNEERLRDALLEVLGLFQLDRSSGAFKPPPPRPSSRAAAASGRLNPLVKSLSDLRPGMTLDGIITNITRFGAFVNIGLSEEGMIHISELSMEYVQTPSDVVSIGDRVQPRVLDVEPSKRRIALSLKPTPMGPSLERPQEGGRNIPLDTRVRRGLEGGAPSGPRRRGGPARVGRNQALEQLENLFKKE